MEIDREHLRFHRHHRLQIALRHLAIRQRIGTIKRDAGPDPKVMRIGPSKNTGGIGDAPLVFIKLQGIDGAKLAVGEIAVDIVGAREVRHQAQAAKRVETE